MKFILTAMLFISGLYTNLAQEKEFAILNADTTWGKEIIHFPIDWVPELKLTGFEELRFAPKWGTPEHDNFWSLAMAWQVKAAVPLELSEIIKNVEFYFDGLMKPNHWATQFAAPNLLLLPNKEAQNKIAFYGKLKVFDGFYTGKIISLNIKGESVYNPQLGVQTIVLRYSPKSYDHSIWQALQNVTIIE